MKTIVSKLMFVALSVMTFVACQDVPQPYDIPGTGSNIPGTTTEIEGGTGEGTVEAPYNTIAALNMGKKLAAGETTENYVYIKGIVVSIATDKNSGEPLNYNQSSYGNATFYISEDGSAVNQFYVYRALYLGNKKYDANSNDPILQVGDEVVVCAKITNYNGTIETAQGDGFLYSLNGENRGGEVSQDVSAKNTIETALSVADVLTVIDALGEGETSADWYYVKGKIKSIKTAAADIAKYKNIDYYITDDGQNEVQVFRGKNLDNTDFTEAGQINVGDEVIVIGQPMKYKNEKTGATVPELAQGNYIVKITKGTGGETPTPTPEPTGEAKGDGTEANPYNAIAAYNAAAALASDAKSDNDVYVKGIISTVTYAYDTQHGTATFKISEDGQATNEFTVYGCLYFNNQKYTAGDNIKKGDEVVVCGKLTNYKGTTPEMASGANWLVSLNGKTEATGGETPTPTPDVTGEGSHDKPFNVASVIAKGTASTTSNVYVTGYIVGWVEGQVLSSGANFNGNATVKTNLLIADDANETNIANCIPVQLPNNAVRTGLNLQDNPTFYGKQVLLYGNLEKYFGAAGVKGVTYAECESQTFGTNPTATE